MREFSTLGKRKAVLGMIHLQPLPGTLFYQDGSFDQTLETAVESARALYRGGADGCLVQTVDRIYSAKDESDPARTTAMGLIAHAIVQATGTEFQVGVQLMQNALKASLAVAKVAGGSFIRAGAVVGTTLTAHGMVEANPLDVMEYRKKIDAWDVKVIAEVDSMHFKWFGEPKPTAEIARSAKYVGADAVSLGAPDEGENAGDDRLGAQGRAGSADYLGGLHQPRQRGAVAGRGGRSVCRYLPGTRWVGRAN